MVTHRESLIIDISRSLKELSTLMHQTQATNISSGCIEKKMKEVGVELIKCSGSEKSVSVGEDYLNSHPEIAKIKGITGINFQPGNIYECGLILCAYCVYEDMWNEELEKCTSNDKFWKERQNGE